MCQLIALSVRLQLATRLSMTVSVVSCNWRRRYQRLIAPPRLPRCWKANISCIRRKEIQNKQMKWGLTLFVLASRHPNSCEMWRHQSCVWVWQGKSAGGKLLACNHSPVRFVIIERCLLCEECSQPATPVQTLSQGYFRSGQPSPASH